MSNLLSNYPQLALVGVALAAVLLVKKLVKWAIILGVLFVVVLPYLDQSGALDGLKSQLGLN